MVVVRLGLCLFAFLSTLSFAEPLADPDDRNPIETPSLETGKATLATMVAPGGPKAGSSVAVNNYDLKISATVPLAFQKRFYGPRRIYFCETESAELWLIFGDSYVHRKIADLKLNATNTGTFTIPVGVSPAGFYRAYVKVRGKVLSLSNGPSEREFLNVESESTSSELLYEPG